VKPDIKKELEMSASPNRFASAYADFMMKIRWPLLVVLLGITVFFALQIPNVDIRNDPDTLLPETNRYVATNAYGEQKYGMGNLMVFGLEVLEGEGAAPEGGRPRDFTR
jgi:uncharacterized membrane protein YdfJ with MMPL/SSD domain